MRQGRPVSQCAHCRTLRKSRSAHVRCECGEKAHSKGACNHEGDASADNCCCSHGSKCSCSLKKEHLEPVPESDSDGTSSSSTPNESRRPRATTAQSENCLTIFTNGHHKPSHKHNQMAHKCGLPYVVPRAHSIHGPSPSGLAIRSVDNLPHTNTVEALHSESHIKDSIASAQQEQRMVKSEHGSPLLSADSNLDLLNGQLPPLDFSLAGEYNYLQTIDTFSSIPDVDQPIFSAGLASAASIDWSHYDGLDFNNDNFAASSYSQAPSFTGFDFSSIDQPALTTTSTSGEISEVEDFAGPLGDSMIRPALSSHPNGSDYNSEYGGDIDKSRLSTASSYVGLPQAQILANNVEAFDLEEFMNGTSSSGMCSGVTTNMSGAYADGIKAVSVPPSFDGLSMAGAYNEELLKYGQSQSPFDDSTFTLLPGEDDIDWSKAFQNNGALSIGDISEENIWAAQ
ncbi:hypothetical protein BP6252_06217 [Coleophoma cylindrospora]|uniref:Copper-fist domain-containing protein n=1 Tax=Coleophoma cylindrospora TaxID=1849047 RepID=A0A3D8RLZ0_9HELO|nr:hypothetical protein BP6252_06217 [Coleophoma cylindrospora]